MDFRSTEAKQCLKECISSLGNRIVGDVNGTVTWARCVVHVYDSMSGRGFRVTAVKCDADTNTPETRDKNEIHGQVELEGVRYRFAILPKKQPNPLLFSGNFKERLSHFFDFDVEVEEIGEEDET